MPIPIPAILSLLMGGKGKTVMLLGVALALSLAVSYHFIKVNSLNSQLVTTRADLVEAVANQAKLEDALKVQKESLRLVEAQRQIDQEKLNELAKQYSASNKEVGDLRKMLSRHDLGYLMLRKPGLVEKRMTKATNRFGVELEELTSNE